jgi:hypothetical protein
VIVISDFADSGCIQNILNPIAKKNPDFVTRYGDRTNVKHWPRLHGVNCEIHVYEKLKELGYQARWLFNEPIEEMAAEVREKDIDLIFQELVLPIEIKSGGNSISFKFDEIPDEQFNPILFIFKTDNDGLMLVSTLYAITSFNIVRPYLKKSPNGWGHFVRHCDSEKIIKDTKKMITNGSIQHILINHLTEEFNVW